MFAGGRLKASGFQPTHPHGVRPVSSSHVAWMLFSFNPRARTGCDAKFQNVTHVLGHVSTHAPARGATFPDSTPQLAVVVSTHAPARGATDTVEDLTDFELVSTHAPARGATRIRFENATYLMFQPTHPHGVRHRVAEQESKRPSFNPRTRTGCDRAMRRRSLLWLRFNPRTRTGCDETNAAIFDGWFDVSTHAPARGATAITVVAPSAEEVSTHAPARGATRARCRRCNSLCCFNPRTRTGCDSIQSTRVARQ